MNYLEELFSMKDDGYRSFMAKLTPNLKPDVFIGVRTPELKSLAKKIKAAGEDVAFMENLPHRYFEENQLHAFLISLEKNYDKAMTSTEEFLPYIDNWATCDQLSPKVLKKDLAKTKEAAYHWMESKHTYTLRFGVEVMMRYFLDDYFKVEYLERISNIRSEEYYVNMMLAWYFATALTKQYEATLFVIEEKKLEPWVHNKTIQKAIESYRISEEQKNYLRTLKLKKIKSKEH
ncbi:MAG: DNA alkylation repair protein [Lachnospiraceae bacterium]|nr:DNA alkylation repair protein [Lachnospiraceae bacterium]